MEIRWHYLRAALALTLVSWPKTGQAQSSVPNGIIRLAYRQQMERELSKSVYEIELSCWNDACTLTTLTLNLCYPNIYSDPQHPGQILFGSSFYPKIQRSGTEAGDLSVQPQGDTVLTVLERIEGTTLQYRFEYRSKTESPEVVKGLRSNRFFGDVTGFSGAAVKNSSTLGRVISWYFVPLHGRYPRVKLDCDLVSLDGIPEPGEQRD